MKPFHKYSYSIVTAIIAVNDKIRATDIVLNTSSAHLEQFILLSSKAGQKKIPSEKTLNKALKELSLGLYQSYSTLIETYANVILPIISKYTVTAINDKLPILSDFKFKHNSFLNSMKYRISLLKENPIVEKKTLQALMDEEKYFEDCWSFIVNYQADLNRYNNKVRGKSIIGITAVLATGLAVPIGLHIDDLRHDSEKKVRQVEKKLDHIPERSIALPNNFREIFDISQRSQVMLQLLDSIEEIENGYDIERLLMYDSLIQDNFKYVFSPSNHGNRKNRSVVFQISISGTRFSKASDTNAYLPDSRARLIDDLTISVR